MQPLDVSVPEDKSRQKNTLKTIAGVAGNVLEWYDFAVFGYFGDVIADVFFPPQSGHAALIESFAIFGGAFLMRPVGGVMMGYIGDTVGRKKALEISIFLMAFPTFIMGCLPTYAQVGWTSWVMLLIVRLLQGLSVGGQLMSSLVYTVEQHPREAWGLYGSYVMSAAACGSLLGGVVATVIRDTTTDEQLKSWGWRIPFLSGILVSVVGIYLRYHGGDELHGSVDVPKNPLKMAFAKSNRRALMASTLVPMVWAAGFYLGFVWIAAYMEEFVKPPVPQAFAVNTAALLISMCILFPFCGKLSDIYGRTRVMLVGAVGLIILSPLNLIITNLGNPYLAFLIQTSFGIVLALWGAPMCAWLAESFEPDVRLTSVAFGYNIAHATFGGMSPAIATAMADHVSLWSPGVYLSCVTLLSLLGLYIAPQTIEQRPTSTTGQSDLEPAKQDGQIAAIS
mmetsp:Transcript_12126/g.18481  ORF Transcript_12126/g.18481 Transcript_12126/m.18481 type:complete len:451 (-) Transcript_12126:303-1655(-)|eukprot:CAMPEP_0118707888 /NCGR_PEP_ID=MMETSP0800-20121206/21502_1 /TAXON_ID=210618 ORGANISM="Striatella unipunctata, Strain CCMP2910" /NCGR_SAMPLE_ID=MMETSP0800 /ASSEMBLY_ACC=CAM_ASM_000638 /LENGTH=450 /DNA_ID=CAMNT_0006610861 /DNA_START=53 /DNA_END=1405 /DNA_ORIENTATION=+